VFAIGKTWIKKKCWTKVICNYAWVHKMDRGDGPTTFVSYCGWGKVGRN